MNGAIAIQMTGGPAPLPEDMEIFQKYIDGEMELDEIQRVLIAKYTEVQN